MSGSPGNRPGAPVGSRAHEGPTFGKSLRKHWSLWRWALASAVAALSVAVAVPLFDSGLVDHCRSNVNLGASTTAEECLARGGEVYSTGGNGWGVFVALLGVLVLSWLVPLAIGRRLFPRPPRPAPLAAGEKVRWGKGAWRTTHRNFHWEYEPHQHEWHRGQQIPLLGDTRQATWALHQHALLREQNRLIEEQNRLLAGLPPLPRDEVPAVLPGS